MLFTTVSSSDDSGMAGKFRWSGSDISSDIVFPAKTEIRPKTN